ncbi:MAG: hypothetical protein ACP5KN_11775, partial [Armatimonadota bacterium]
MRRAAVLMTMLLVASAGYAQDFTLVQDGQPRAIVRLRDDPTDVEMLARDELVRYVEMASGAALSAEGDLPGTVELVVREGEPFRIGIDVTPARVKITGSSPIALLMGTYRFLQDHVGCRWFVPGEIGEVVPPRETITIPAGTDSLRPDWDVRTFFLRDEEGYWWALRNGIN